MAIIAPKPWWRLPFAAALAYQARIYKRCQLCGIYDCASISKNNVLPRHHDHWFNRQQFLCMHCHNGIQWNHSQFELPLNATSIGGIASCHYQYPFNQIMLGYKNAQQLQHLPVLIHAIRQLHIPKGCHAKNSFIVRVPSSIARIQQRGFEPLAILTDYLSFHWQIPVFAGVERQERPHQQGLSREARLDNIKDAFYLTNIPPNKNVILFDDVVTTGATMAELASLFQTTHQQRYIAACAILHGN